MTTEATFAPKDLGLFSKMIIHFLNREARHVHAKKVAHIFKVFSEVIQDSISKGSGRELGYLGYFNSEHLAAWNHTVINHLIHCEEDEAKKERIISLWHEIELIIDDQIEQFKREELAVCWGLK
ncbi:hypothetical protein FNH22_09715 [Fulvivirga sp. M361]|uniref:hypothetical protein n=1 Tax=Fulvivirga sp. M361 TaxID=2594266 RepID=UPI00117AF264|nr:hypothetical protein [Fulvivirga sp. M361]TRX59429.1 hypothetical protein FNH22_09715 [Fulvivirga sp. M361]